MKKIKCLFLFISFSVLLLHADNHVLRLNGNRSYVKLSYMPPLKNFTFEACIKNNQEDEGRFTILSWKNMGSNNSTEKDAVMIRLVNGYLAYSEWVNNNWMECYSSKKVNTGRATSIAVSKENNTIIFYINGERSGSYFNNRNNDNYKCETNTLTIGAMLSNFYESYIGVIDEIRLWNRCRSDKEIKAFFQKELTGKEEDLLGYFNFEKDICDKSLHFPLSKSVNATIEQITLFDLKTPQIERLYYSNKNYPAFFLQTNQRGIFYYILSSNKQLNLSPKELLQQINLKKVESIYPQQPMGYWLVNKNKKKFIYGVFVNEFNQKSSVSKCNIF